MFVLCKFCSNEQKFRDVGHLLRKRIELMLALPIHKLERLAIEQEVKSIGKVQS